MGEAYLYHALLFGGDGPLGDEEGIALIRYGKAVVKVKGREYALGGKVAEVAVRLVCDNVPYLLGSYILGIVCAGHGGKAALGSIWTENYNMAVKFRFFRAAKAVFLGEYNVGIYACGQLRLLCFKGNGGIGKLLGGISIGHTLGYHTGVKLVKVFGYRPVGGLVAKAGGGIAEPIYRFLLRHILGQQQFFSNDAAGLPILNGLCRLLCSGGLHGSGNVYGLLNGLGAAGKHKGQRQNKDGYFKRSVFHISSFEGVFIIYSEYHKEKRLSTFTREN